MNSEAVLFSYFYPRPPRGGRPEAQGTGAQHCDISIHALREEGDCLTFAVMQRERNFYPRPPRGGRPRGYASNILDLLFLSTPSARRATHGLDARLCDRGISIHALREEGDRP